LPRFGGNRGAERSKHGARCVLDQLGSEGPGGFEGFYEKFGFKAFAGDATQNWLIMKNGDHVIGLFQGMFEKNILTFNPGWDSNAQKLATFTDIRQLQRELRGQGVEFQQQADETTTGPASFIAVDPDGNPILVDQHV
jgi:lactoylglutathione lyase